MYEFIDGFDGLLDFNVVLCYVWLVCFFEGVFFGWDEVLVLCLCLDDVELRVCFELVFCFFGYGLDYWLGCGFIEWLFLCVVEIFGLIVFDFLVKVVLRVGSFWIFGLYMDCSDVCYFLC